jgi:hypothetical protein
MFFVGNRGYGLSIEEINNNGIVFNFSNKQYDVNFSEQFLLGNIERGCENISIVFEKINSTEVSVVFSLEVKTEEVEDTPWISTKEILEFVNSDYHLEIIFVIVVFLVFVSLWIIKKKRDTNL